MPAPIRVIVHQPALPKYRIPVFRELAGRQKLHVCVWHDEETGLPSVAPEGFDTRRVRGLYWKRLSLYWTQDHFRSMNRSVADVVVLPWSTRYLSLVPALILARFRGVATVVWGHGVSKKESFWRSWLRRWPVRLAGSAMFYSRSVCERFAQGERDTAKLFVAPNALDQGPMQAARESWLSRPDALAKFRKDKGVEGDDNILFVSRLIPANRADLLLRATAILAKGPRPNVKTIVVGAGPELDNLRKLAQELGVADKVVFTGAVYGEPDIAPYFLSANVFCYPRNMGLSLLHALGYALPVVTCDRLESHGPEIDAFEPGLNGMTYRDQDADDLARVLNDILADRPRLAAMSTHAHQTALGKYSLQSMVDGMEAAILHAAKVA
ncbi:MAG: glycosyltransferase family 4 protein [Pyrinomonadaceae bacterium]|nr:glycosyltransferase family 4 protein [Phycisphaerales bacterium]